MGGIAAYALLRISLASCACYPTQLFYYELTWFTLGIAGSLFPDIDIKSKGRFWYDRALLCAAAGCLLIQQLVGLGIVALLYVIPRVLRHRGATHQPMLIVLATAIVATTLTHYAHLERNFIIISALFFIAGVFSHVLLDFGIRKTLQKTNFLRTKKR